MNSNLLASAQLVVPNTGLLVNMVRLRVRQLSAGSRSMVVVPPGMGLADIALSEIGAEKLSNRPALESVPETLPAIISFPAAPQKKAA